MATYKRQLWTSGYLYRQRCPYCGTVVEYTDRQLGYRSWYPNGFIYCTRCRKPLRHNEIFAVNPDGSAVYATQTEADLAVREGYYGVMGAQAPAPGVVTPAAGAYAAPAQGAPEAQYDASAYAPAAPAAPEAQAPVESAACANCEREYVPGRDHFCPSCGTKLD